MPPRKTAKVYSEDPGMWQGSSSRHPAPPSVVYHMRGLHMRPNLEAIHLTAPHAGWNPDRDTGALGTGIYATQDRQQVDDESALEHEYALDPSRMLILNDAQANAMETFARALMHMVIVTTELHYSMLKSPAARHLPAWREMFLPQDSDEFGPAPTKYAQYEHAVTDLYDAALALKRTLKKPGKLNELLSRELKSARAKINRSEFLRQFVSDYLASLAVPKHALGEHTRSNASDPVETKHWHPTPITTLLSDLNYEGVMYTGDASGRNNSKSHGIILFDYAKAPEKVTERKIGKETGE